jgi:hypothetical protein
LLDAERYDARLDEPELRARITATLECIRELFQDEKELRKRYGLRPYRTITNNQSVGLLGPGNGGGVSRASISSPLGLFFSGRSNKPLLDTSTPPYG